MTNPANPDLREDFLIFGAPHLSPMEVEEVLACLRSGWIGTGPRVARFESDFARYKGVPPECVAAVNSCTAALHLSLLALDLEPGSEVITTPLTFCATVNAILHAGLRPVLADVDPVSMNLDPRAVEQVVTAKTRAILPVHFAGNPCDMDALTETAARHGLQMVEDCAHAIEAKFQGKPIGTFGDFGCFSFYVTKNVVTGEGGMVLGRVAETIGRVRTLALHGLSRDAWKRFGDQGFKHYHVVECGFKYNMMDLQAAIGIHQLARVEENWRKRARIWARYQEAFSDLPVTRPAEARPGNHHAYHLYTLLIDEYETGLSRDAFLDAMTARRVGVGVHYLSLPEHPYYRETLGWQPGDFPHACRIGRQTVSLPLSPKLSEDDVSYVIDAVRSILLRRPR
ncbi:MAG TPA: DegT/DnrJ/EryC1/StrS family aminotransferase [Methylococcus sp.]|nr:DegT/DnrJ/EryC1/StrS family aminotransferase [Methylococcus sp.]